jgi:hypothetical protein
VQAGSSRVRRRAPSRTTSGTRWCAPSKDPMKPAAWAQRCRGDAEGPLCCTRLLRVRRPRPPVAQGSRRDSAGIGKGPAGDVGSIPRRRLRGGRTGGVGRRWRRHGRAEPTRASRARVGPAQALGGRLRQGGRQGGSRRWRRLRGMVALGAARGQVRRAETDELAGPLSVRLSSQLFCRATAHPCGAIPRRRAAQRRCQAPARCRTSAVG